MRGSERTGPVAGSSPAPDRQSASHTLSVDGCTVTVRAVRGARASELFIHGQPTGVATDAEGQAEALYQTLLEVVDRWAGGLVVVVSETLFFRNLQRDGKPVRRVRQRLLAQADQVNADVMPVEVEQPPADPHVLVEFQMHLLVPGDSKPTLTVLNRTNTCDCDHCARARGVALSVGPHSRSYSGALYGTGATAYEQTHDVLAAAEQMLSQAGMSFTDVVRTWIYLDEMVRDYPALNKARREFFAARDIDPPPASTGIGAGLLPETHNLCLSFVAIRDNASFSRTLMTTPTLNEAPQYGADFSRGMRVTDSHGDAAFVSGTASLNEVGQSVHQNDVRAQADRMLVNVSALLDAQGASFADIVSATTYVRHKDDIPGVTERLEKSGYTGFPHAVVEARVCRPELLCETEALAFIRPQKTSGLG